MISMNTGPYRLSLATLMAAPLVYGLFLAANALITVREVTLVVPGLGRGGAGAV